MTVNHCIAGEPATDRATFGIRTTGTTAVRVKVGTNSSVTSGVVFSPTVTPDGNGYSMPTVTGLTPGFHYWYQVEENGALGATVRRFRTAPSGAASFTFAMSGCCDNPSSTALTAIAGTGAHFFVHNGDFFYNDITSTPTASQYRSQWNAKLTDSTHEAVQNVMALSYMWSDHDSAMRNNGTGATMSWIGSTAVPEYRKIFPVTSYGGASGIYRTWTYGRARIIQVDGRTFKSALSATDNSSKTILGATQKAWFKDVITQSTSAYHFILFDQPWIGPRTAGEDEWMGYDTERQEIGNFLAASGKKGMILSGDMHALAIDNGSHSVGGWPVFHAAPLHQSASSKGGPYTFGPYPSSGIIQQYGIVTVTDTGGSTITVRATGYSASGTQRMTYETTVPVGGDSPQEPGPDVPASGVAYNMATAAAETTNGAIGTDIGGVNMPVVQLRSDLGYPTGAVLQLASGHATAAAARTANSYIAWTVDFASDWTPGTLALKAARGNTSGSRGLEVRWSVDNYAAPLIAQELAAGFTRPVWMNLSAALSAPKQTGPVEFRLYTYAPSTVTTVEVDAITVSGTPDVAGSPPVTTNLNPTADATVLLATPSTNYGTTAVLDVDGDGTGRTDMSYMKFSLAGLSGNVTAANLRLRCTDSASVDTQRVVLVADNSWTETGITWNNKPATSTLLGTIGPPTIGQDYTTTIPTSVVQAALGGTLSIALEQTATDGAGYGSRETATPPRLQVTTESSTPPPDVPQSIRYNPGTGPAGQVVTIGNSDDTGGAAYTVLSGGGTADLRYRDDDGGMIRVNSNGSVIRAVGWDDLSISQGSDLVAYFEVQRTSNPGSNLYPLRIASGSTIVTRAQITTGGVLTLDVPGGTNWNMPGTIPLGATFLVGVRAKADATTGELEMRVWLNPSLYTSTPDHTSGVIPIATSNSINEARFGNTSANNSGTTWLGKHWVTGQWATGAVGGTATVTAGANLTRTVGSTVALGAVGSPSGGTFSWTVVGGQSVTLTGADTANPSYTAPATAGQTTFQVAYTAPGGAVASPAQVTVQHVLPDAPQLIGSVFNYAVLDYTATVATGATVAVAQTSGPEVPVTEDPAGYFTVDMTAAVQEVTFDVTATRFGVVSEPQSVRVGTIGGDSSTAPTGRLVWTGSGFNYAITDPSLATPTTTTAYSASTAVIPNPDRGWVQYTETHYQTDNTGHVALDQTALTTARTTTQTLATGDFGFRTLVFRYYVIEKFLGLDTIDQAYLDLIDADCATARAAGVKLIPRFAYSTSGDMTPPYGADPAPARVLGHVAQITDVLSQNADVIHAVQAGFIGMWGEWYYTDNFGDLGTLTTQNWTDRKAVLQALLDGLDPRIFVLVRYPGLKHRMFVTDGDTRDESRVGFHNDAFLAPSDDYGTYNTFPNGLSAAQLRAYLAAETGAVPMGMESAVANPPTSEWANASAELAAYSWTFMNPLYHPDVLASWSQANKDEVARRLGYRLRLVSSTLPVSAPTNGAVRVTLQIANDGWSAPDRTRPIQVVFVGGSTVVRETSTVDVRGWAPGTRTVSLTVPAPPVAGSYAVHLRLPDSAVSLAAANEFAVQFANTGLWDAATGRNSLQHTITVT